jgi:hypothetical protein
MKYRQGKFTPKNKAKYKGNVNDIWYRSGLEQRMMVYLDSNPSVLGWHSEETIVPYWDKVQCKWRRYFVDFYMECQTKNGVKKYSD